MQHHVHLLQISHPVWPDKNPKNPFEFTTIRINPVVRAPSPINAVYGAHLCKRVVQRQILGLHLCANPAPPHPASIGGSSSGRPAPAKRYSLENYPLEIMDSSINGPGILSYMT